MSKTHLKKNIAFDVEFSRFLVFNLSQHPQVKSKNRGFFRYLGPTWANLGQLGPKGRPKRLQESQIEANKPPKRANMRPNDVPRKPKSGQEPPQENPNDFQSAPICLQDPPGALT